LDNIHVKKINIKIVYNSIKNEWRFMMKLNCSQCNSTNINKGLIRAVNAPIHMFPEDSYDKKAPLNSHLRKSSEISSYYCLDCGYILGMYLTEPQNLK